MNPTPESQARCQSCGQALAANATFCRSCGTRTAPEQPANAPVESQPPAPSAPAETQVLPPSQPQASHTQAPIPPAAQPPQKAKSGGWGKPVLIAALVGLLVGGGVAAAILLLGGDDSKQASAPLPESAATVPANEATFQQSGEANSSDETAGSETAGFPSESRAQMASEIQGALLAYHEEILSGNPREAWGLLSARKRAQAQREEGFGAWAKNQATLSPYLTPAGLTVRIEELEGEGVARVLLSGMGWSAPGSPCTEWSGLTWVKYEGGRWTYDPGYSTTADRERAWKPRYDELLGANC